MQQKNTKYWLWFGHNGKLYNQTGPFDSRQAARDEGRRIKESLATDTFRWTNGVTLCYRTRLVVK